MSLSQKHSGKVLVPWFNNAEWKLVYTLIYSEDNRNWPKALEILKIWKHRTPLLSAGVEGTLIVLEALLLEPSQMSNFEISHVFSTSLVRFLNLCAANNDRQGTFYKTAMRNDLPKWIVGVRHDIAHSHKVPSQSMLELSLKFCLEWLRDKYWEVQDANIRDFVVGKVENSMIEDGVYVYLNLGKKNRKLIRLVNRFVKNCEDQEQIIKHVNKRLGEEIRINKDQSEEKISKLLLSKLRLSTDCEFFPKLDGLITLMHETGILHSFLSQLLCFTCDEKYAFAHREIASFWIKHIFGVITGGMDKTFTVQILEQVSPFTTNFVEEVLQFYEAPKGFIEDSLALVRAFNTQKSCKNEKIFTVDDLNLQGVNDEFVVDIGGGKQSSSRWKVIDDTSVFLNLPLGILPHQDRSKNPLLTV